MAVLTSCVSSAGVVTCLCSLWEPLSHYFLEKTEEEMGKLANTVEMATLDVEMMK